MNNQQLLDQLCQCYGIAADYTDIWGKLHPVAPSTKQAILAAMGVITTQKANLQQALLEYTERSWRRPLPPVQVCRQPDPPRILLSIPENCAVREFHWHLHLEFGQRESGRLCPKDLDVAEKCRIDETDFARYIFSLPEPIAIGYHQFILESAEIRAEMSLIVTPERCYRPPALAESARIWGLSLQLYALRSRRNWGIGDFSDLQGVLKCAAALGADVVGLNPLHALFIHNPGQISPYTPSSRQFINVLYLDVEAMAGYAECVAARELVAEASFQAQLRALRAGELVDYSSIAAVKLQLFELVYRSFREHYIEAESARAREFREFQGQQGDVLFRYSLYEALQEHFKSIDSDFWGWPVWPEPYRNSESPEVEEFAALHHRRIEFYSYLQWQAAEQLAAVGRQSLELGLGVGLYQDLALSVARDSAETWSNQQLYALDASIGAPPDDFSPKGQNWGLPPMVPEQLQQRAYQPFIDLLRSNMRYAGAIRIDHVMGLMRLYWIPEGSDPTVGSYVSYPLDDLLGIIALESQRNRCLVIGEDLGTVPPELRRTLAASDILSYRLLYFEKTAAGEFLAPDAYPHRSLVAVTTHDLPTLNGYWQGRDLAVRDALNLYPSPELRARLFQARAEDRNRLQQALAQQQLLPSGLELNPDFPAPMPYSAIRAIHVYLARSPAVILSVQLEDVFGQAEQVNLPGTVDEYPNWRRKLELDLEDWLEDERMQDLAKTLRCERRR